MCGAAVGGGGDAHRGVIHVWLGLRALWWKRCGDGVPAADGDELVGSSSARAGRTRAVGGEQMAPANGTTARTLLTRIHRLDTRWTVRLPVLSAVLVTVLGRALVLTGPGTDTPGPGGRHDPGLPVTVWSCPCRPPIPERYPRGDVPYCDLNARWK